VRRCYWETEVEDVLLENKVALNLLYVEVLSDIESGCIVPTKDQLSEIQSLQHKNSKKDLLRFARNLKFYGYVQFKPCFMDYPQPGTRAFIAAGNQELNFRLPMPDGTVKESSLKVHSRIRLTMRL
jgi:sorting nexin-17